MDQKELKTGIIYCRVSSLEQVENTSLESQEARCREYAEKENIKVLKVFIEKGESAKTADRTKFQEALQYCGLKKSSVDKFIVYKLDRFARNQIDHVTTRAILTKCGTSLVSATEPINDEPIGRLMEGVLSSFAEFDNNVRTERSKGGMYEKVKQGIWQWGAPIGYYRPHKGSNLEIDKDKKLLIHLAFVEYAKGGHTYKSLAKFLNDRGLRTNLGKPVYPQHIEKMLKNPIYCGIVKAFDLEVNGVHEPIISRELFQDCQHKGKKPKVSRNKKNSTFPLRRLVTCPDCQKPLTGSFSKGNGGKYAYYHHQKQGCGKARSISKSDFEKVFVDYLDRITPSKKYEKAFKAVMLDIWQSNYKKFSEESEKITRLIKRLEKERDKIFDLHRSGTYSEDDFMREKARISDKMLAQKQLLRDNHIEEFNMEEALDYCFMFVSETSKMWKRMQKQSFDRLLRFQNKIFPEKIMFDGNKFETNNLSLIYKINQEYGDEKSNLVTLQGIEP